MYFLLRVDPQKEQDWKQYTVSMLAFSLAGVLFTYAILRLQHLLPLNPQGLGPFSDHLAFNTAVSFTTNTNWQSYGGESTASYLSQMVGLTFHNFTSAAVGIAIAAALVRGIARQSAKTIGNFWVDLVRVNLYVLLPLCIVYAVFLVSQGMIQNFKPYDTARILDPYTAEVAKKDDNGDVVKDAQGNPVTERAQDRNPDHRAGAHGLAGGDQDARHQRRRLHERQRLASLREPDAALKLHPDALHFSDPQRPDLLPGPHGEKPAPRVGGLGRHGGRSSWLGVWSCWSAEIGRQPAACMRWGWSGVREHGGHLDEVCERRRVLVWVRGVGVHETAAVGAYHLDRHLRGHRPLRDGLAFGSCVLPSPGCPGRP